MKFNSLIALVLMAGSSMTMAATIKGTNYQSPYCGCCKEWVKHMEENGFEMEVVYEDNLTATKIELGIRPEYASCHTAKIAGYSFEGHIPADDIKRFIESNPKRMIGLAVPGMPMGSPGMDYNGEKHPYEVVAFDKDGKTMVWARHNQ